MDEDDGPKKGYWTFSDSMSGKLTDEHVEELLGRFKSSYANLGGKTRQTTFYGPHAHQFNFEQTQPSGNQSNQQRQHTIKTRRRVSGFSHAFLSLRYGQMLRSKTGRSRWGDAVPHDSFVEWVRSYCAESRKKHHNPSSVSAHKLSRLREVWNSGDTDSWHAAVCDILAEIDR